MTLKKSPPDPAAVLWLHAPLSGLIVPLEQVPDPVFAEKMVGDGIAIEPTSNTLLSPCDGVVCQVHASKHAIQIKSDSGPEILVHVGLDTVMLNGEGFTTKVSEGDRVVSGQALLEFDADLIAKKARSLMTEIVIANHDVFGRITVLADSFANAGKDPLLQIDLTPSPDSLADSAGEYEGEWQVSSPITLHNPQGIHARPAAVLSKAVKNFQAEVEVRFGNKACDGRSVVGLMGLNTKQGDKLVIASRGQDAEAAVAAVTGLIEEGLGEEISPASASGGSKNVVKESPLLNRLGNKQADISGVGAAAGVAVGKVFVLSEEVFDYAEVSNKTSEQEQARLEAAIGEVESSIQTLVGAADKGDGQAEIFSAHLEMLSDPTLKKVALDFIRKAKTAEFSWQQAISQQAEVLSQLNNPLLEQRGADLQDIRARVLRSLMNKVGEGIEDIPQGAVLVVHDLTPSMIASLSLEKVSGVVTSKGGATSHAAILARAAGIPYVAGVKEGFEKLTTGLPVILDGKTGGITLNPDDKALKKIEIQRQLARERSESALASKHEPGVTLDGKYIEIVANITSENDAAKTVELGGDGVGLLRSEFLFQDRSSAPDEEEQFANYRAIQKGLAGRPLIVRTLDIGGDKPLSYLPLAEEENPFLGERGIRVSLNRPSVFLPQVRAILRANAEAVEGRYGNVRIMFPMVSVIEEVRVAKKVVAEEAAKLGVPVCEIGIMVEVPAVAAMAHQFAAEVDFFSIGSNDLTQYSTAIDRGHPQLAAQADGLNPGILQLIKMTVEGAHAHGKWVGVCGGIASEPEAIPILLGLGVDELSVSVPLIPEVKALVRETRLSDCEAIAASALTKDSAASVRALTLP